MAPKRKRKTKPEAKEESKKVKRAKHAIEDVCLAESVAPDSWEVNPAYKEAQDVTSEEVVWAQNTADETVKDAVIEETSEVTDTDLKTTKETLTDLADTSKTSNTAEITEKEQPAAEKEQPAAEKDQPSAEKEQPAAEKEQPAAEKEQPAAEKEQPAAEKEQPAAEKEELKNEVPEGEGTEVKTTCKAGFLLDEDQQSSSNDVTGGHDVTDSQLAEMEDGNDQSETLQQSAELVTKIKTGLSSVSQYLGHFKKELDVVKRRIASTLEKHGQS